MRILFDKNNHLFNKNSKGVRLIKLLQVDYYSFMSLMKILSAGDGKARDLCG
jgi:hypothetical protein